MPVSKSKWQKKIGGGIEDCIDPGEVYEVVDPGIEVVLRQRLDLPRITKPVVISTSVLIMTQYLRQHSFKQVMIFGVNIASTKIKEDLAKVGLEFVASIINAWLVPHLLIANITQLTSTLLLAAALTGMITNNHFISNCSEFVAKLPSEEIIKQLSDQQGEVKQKVAYLETLDPKIPKFFVKGSEMTDIYISDSNQNNKIK